MTVDINRDANHRKLRAGQYSSPVSFIKPFAVQSFNPNIVFKYTAIMVHFSQLVVVLTAVHLAIAAPTEQTEASVQKRGPHNFVMGPDHPLMMARRNESLSRRATNYVQDYTTGETVYFAPESGEFYVSWDTTDDFVVGVGWNPGSTE